MLPEFTALSRSTDSMRGHSGHFDIDAREANVAGCGGSGPLGEPRELGKKRAETAKRCLAPAIMTRAKDFVDIP